MPFPVPASSSRRPSSSRLVLHFLLRPLQTCPLSPLPSPPSLGLRSASFVGNTETEAYPRWGKGGGGGGGLRCFREKRISRQNTTDLFCYALFCFDLRCRRGGLLSAVSYVPYTHRDKRKEKHIVQDQIPVLLAANPSCRKV
ncbi:hypothetical protein LY76DRAFT_148371 [Colletotrichum caudatum]|nr:hypothetical protein LY76DRAFT_148371 [Colletotrichum caudatum]